MLNFFIHTHSTERNWYRGRILHFGYEIIELTTVQERRFVERKSNDVWKSSDPMIIAGSSRIYTNPVRNFISGFIDTWKKKHKTVQHCPDELFYFTFSFFIQPSILFIGSIFIFTNYFITFDLINSDSGKFEWNQYFSIIKKEIMKKARLIDSVSQWQNPELWIRGKGSYRGSLVCSWINVSKACRGSQIRCDDYDRNYLFAHSTRKWEFPQCLRREIHVHGYVYIMVWFVRA